MSKLEDILKNIETQINIPFVTARFGDHWKDHAQKNYDKETLINIAWKNGRKAILLERVLKELLDAKK